jgi:hypothetical protein
VVADDFGDVLSDHGDGLRWLLIDLKGPIARRSNTGVVTLPHRHRGARLHMPRRSEAKPR